MTNLKSSNWLNKIQLIDVKSNFEDAYGSNGRKRMLTKDALNQIGLAISKPKPLKSVRTISTNELWLHRTEISYPNVNNNVWNKTGTDRIAKFTLNSLTSELSDNNLISSEKELDLTAIKVNNLGKYLSFEVEPRFNSKDKKKLLLEHQESEKIALIRLAKEVATFSKSNIDLFDTSKAEYLAIPRDNSESIFFWS